MTGVTATEKLTTRVALYARYSSDLQRDASIDDQLRVCRARVEREGWCVNQTFTDSATSGATTLRHGYQALLAALRSGCRRCRDGGEPGSLLARPGAHCIVP